MARRCAAGGDGWADVWKRHYFAWEYKGKRANLDAAFEQLRQYALALENPPLARTFQQPLDPLADRGIWCRSPTAV